MAKNLYNVTFKSDFSFSKLHNKIDKLIDETMQKEGNLVAKTAKDTINEGKLKPLSAATKQKRLDGYSDYMDSSDHKPKRQTDMTPLRYTSRLLNSFKVKEDGVELVEYGLEHNFGRGEPKREFISFPGSPKLKKEEKKISDRLIDNMNKAMK